MPGREACAVGGRGRAPRRPLVGAGRACTASVSRCPRCWVTPADTAPLPTSGHAVPCPPACPCSVLPVPHRNGGPASVSPIPMGPLLGGGTDDPRGTGRGEGSAGCPKAGAQHPGLLGASGTGHLWDHRVASEWWTSLPSGPSVSQACELRCGISHTDHCQGPALLPVAPRGPPGALEVVRLNRRQRARGPGLSRGPAPSWRWPLRAAWPEPETQVLVTWSGWAQ